MKTIKIKEMVKYAGHSINSNGSVNLTLKAAYSECVNSIALLQVLNNDVKIQVKKGADKPFKIGIFRIKEVKFDGDGESVIKFNTITDFADTDAMNNLIPMGDEPKEFTVLFAANVEEEEEEDEE